VRGALPGFEFTPIQEVIKETTRDGLSR